MRQLIHFMRRFIDFAGRFMYMNRLLVRFVLRLDDVRARLVDVIRRLDKIIWQVEGFITQVRYLSGATVIKPVPLPMMDRKQKA